MPRSALGTALCAARSGALLIRRPRRSRPGWRVPVLRRVLRAAPRTGHGSRHRPTHSRNRQRRPAPATRFSAGVVFRSFTLFATFSLYGHAEGPARGLRKPAG